MEANPPGKDIALIIIKSTYTSLSQEEQEKLSQYLNASEANRAKYRELTEAESLKRKLAQYGKRNENKDVHFQTILQKVNKNALVFPLHGFKKYSWVAAAAVLILLSTGVWFFINQQRNGEIPVSSSPSVQQDVLPGKEGAVLTLADGSQVVLDSLGEGIVATQQGTQLELQNGQLAYDAASASNGNLVFNTLTTPKGREFKVLLPDGTQAWLNSSSSIRYPVQFDDNERLVYITGEVYFEVAALAVKGKNTKTPFIVQVSTPEGEAGAIEVLGTHFNINAYESKSKTTLLEGSVRVKAQTGSPVQASDVILKPGQQAQVVAGGHQIKTVAADVDKVMAWRRGFFNFNDASLHQVMQELARWYDIEVEYESGVPHFTFAGELSRNMKLSSVLQALEESKVRFKQEGRKIIVLK